MYVILQLQHSVGDVSNSTSSTVQSLTELVVFFLIGVLKPESIRNVMRNAWNTVLKATEKQPQARNSVHSDGPRGIFDTDAPRITAKTVFNEHVRVLYPCHSDVQLYRPKSVVEIDMIRTNHNSTERILKLLLHLGFLTKHGTYQRTLVKKWGLVMSKRKPNP